MGSCGLPVRDPIKSLCGLPWVEAGHARTNPGRDFYGVYQARSVRVNHGHARTGFRRGLMGMVHLTLLCELDLGLKGVRCL